MARVADALDWINRAVGAVVMWLALTMVLVQFAVVLMRYVFGFSSIFINESVLYLHASIFMLGAGYTLWAQGHVRVDIFYGKLTARGQALVDIFGHLALLGPSLVMLLYWSWPMVRRSWAILEGPISVGGIPASYLLKSLVPAFCVLLLIQGLSALIRDVIRLREARNGA
ncbi:MAG: TRAP transporter small permease subunit [Pararhodobacter sp.]|nr:TRAP transporter small permease subunit [Pararhodobacter sp.]